MKLNFLNKSLNLNIIRTKLLNISFFYNRAKLINKILKTRGFKEIYLIILIKLISRLYKNRIDYFDVKILLNGIYDQYFPFETSQKPMYDLLSLKEPMKKMITYKSAHSPPASETSKEILKWFK